jgi:membrane associated rhomboid family serine protease
MTSPLLSRSNPAVPGLRRRLIAVAGFVGAVWIAYAASLVWPGLLEYGLIPRSSRGLLGLATMPFLHGGLLHLLANSVPLAVLLVLLALTQSKPLEIVAELTLFSGLLLWLFGRTAVHIGASALVSSLVLFLVVSGLRGRRPGPMLVAILVGVLYGLPTLLGVIPRFGSNISWEGHLLGALAGAAAGWLVGDPAGEPVEPPALPE